ncbi:50S ribosomal protein L34e [Candidatus Woesearchaeota archaeon]|jgi:large subunit ribosomal protein L34e|nr:50S ribosomal protein L34e [Candidatus Woesearchaeota archaeon]
MVSPKHRSGSKRKVFVKTPGGKTTTHYRKRKPSSAKCGSCGAVLKGVPRELPSKMKNLPKTAKRPQRPFGGVLCTKCMRSKFKTVARAK